MDPKVTTEVEDLKLELNYLRLVNQYKGQTLEEMYTTTKRITEIKNKLFQIRHIKTKTHV